MSSRLRAIATETVRITEAGSYRAAAGEVTIGEQVTRAVAGTRLYLPGDVVEAPSPVRDPAVIRVTGESTLAATGRLAHSDHRLAPANGQACAPLEIGPPPADQPR